MLCGLSRAQKNNGDVVVVLRANGWILIDIDFRKARAEFFQQWSNLRLGFFAEMTAGAGINRDLQRPRQLQPAVFLTYIGSRRFPGAQPSSFDELLQSFRG